MLFACSRPALTVVPTLLRYKRQIETEGSTDIVFVFLTLLYVVAYEANLRGAHEFERSEKLPSLVNCTAGVGAWP